MQWYWAEIKSGTDRQVVFYTEIELARRNLLRRVHELRSDFKIHGRPVGLGPSDIERLGKAGVEVLMPRFRALDGTWHWFSGIARMDAFRLSAEFEAALWQRGSIAVQL